VPRSAKGITRRRKARKGEEDKLLPSHHGKKTKVSTELPSVEGRGGRRKRGGG
jgi:hypothetical protein